jgi:hypothetical protein
MQAEGKKWSESPKGHHLTIVEAQKCWMDGWMGGWMAGRRYDMNCHTGFCLCFPRDEMATKLGNQEKKEVRNKASSMEKQEETKGRQ